MSDWLVGGGEMGERIRAHDWSNTPLGPTENWSPALRMMIRFLLANRFPLLLWWGPHYVSIYNDAYRPVLGTKHPWALGRPLSECWSEIWHILQPLVDVPFKGGPATWNEDILLEINRHGFLEETHLTIAYSPVPDETVPSGIGGVLATVHEITEKVVAERRVVALRDLGVMAIEAKTAEEACIVVGETLTRHAKEIPFALIYLITPDGKHARLACTSCARPDERFAPELIEFGSDEQPWPLTKAAQLETTQVIEDLAGQFGAAVPAGPWSDPPRQAVVVPVRSNIAHQLAGFLVAGVSARLRLDELYRSFLELLAGQIATAIASARAYEEERKRAEALAEIDRAKTVFFSNVSHEFRTPLALMLGPLEDTLTQSGNLSAADRERLETAHRNSVRLLKLVNTLLDFSRIEAGRIEASYEPTDLAALTAELASVFRSAVERAGMRLAIDCPPLAEPLYVDRQMWEKIVLNLLSNAFKFTFEGEIGVSLRQAEGFVELTVRDTGIGIPAEELPCLFERFHRVKGAQGRSYEGSGIGLALVRELAKLHGGIVRVESELDRGSRFMVSLPCGKAHLPADRIEASRSLASTGLGSDAYVEEVLHWWHDSRIDKHAALVCEELTAESMTEPKQAAVASTQHILLADDNADMCEYVSRLLTQHGYVVAAVADGQAALSAARGRRPDLVLADIMMPILDGFGLLSNLRADPELRDVPVIFLSARAGEDARIEGMQAGADDYLVKPFSARELLARVESHLKMARFRRDAGEALRYRTEQFEALINKAPLGVYLVDADFRIREVNPVAMPVFGDIPGGVVGRDLDEIIHTLWERKYADEIVGIFRHTLQTGEPYITPERAEFRIDRGVTEYYEWRVDRIPLPDGRFGAVCYFRDISQQVQARLAIAESEKRFRHMADHAPVMIWVTEADATCTFLSESWYKFTGQTRETGLGFGWLEAVHPDDSAVGRATFVAANQKREPFRLEYRLRRHDGEYRWAIDAAAPRFGDNGDFLGYIGSVFDITERKQAEETRQFLIAELNHRVKNTLASVQAIVQHTLRRSKNPVEFANTFAGRLQSLSRVHTLLSNATWKGAGLHELIRDQLLQGPVDEARLTAWGPAVQLDAQLALHIALMLHELGTNCAKYGALSVPDGRVAITWSIKDHVLQLRWAERGGPTVAEPTRRGFGTMLINQSVKSQGGTAQALYEAEGVTWEIAVPLPVAVGPWLPEPSIRVDSTSPNQRQQQTDEPRMRLAGRCFLVVEDEPLVGLDLADGLEDAGSRVEGPVGTEAAALQIIETKKLDGALLDANLHGRPVDEIAAALTRRNIPFLFVTGYDRDSLPEAFRSAAILNKPFSREQLHEAISKLVDRGGDAVRLTR